MSRAGARDRGWSVLTVILASIGVAVTAMTLIGAVHDLGTAGSLSSILGLYVGVIACVVARHLSRRMQEARLLSLRREDRRNKDHLASMINLCKSLVLGAMSSETGSPAAMSAMRHAAQQMAAARALCGHLLTEGGMRVAGDVRALAFSSVSREACAPADLSVMLGGLGMLEGELLGIDGDALVERRMREAGAADTAPE